MSDRITSPRPEERAIEQGGTLSRVFSRWVADVSRAVGGQTPHVLPPKTIAQLPAASAWTGGLVYVTDDVGGAVPVFSDGTSWRRVTDRAVVTT